MKRIAAGLALALLLSGCVRETVRRTAVPPPPPRLSAKTIANAIPTSVKDRAGWATAVVAALDAIGMTPAPEPVCAVLAIIEQESNFVANPPVANLAKMIDTKLNEMSGYLGPLGRPALDRVLAGTAPGHKQSFAQRLKSVRTERDVDLVFRDLVAFYRARYPKTVATAEVAGALFAGKEVDDWNPITTAGSMQVSVRFAAEIGARRGLNREQVRDALYTREGGVEIGTARLFAYQAGYDRMIYRFADYNAGAYASRNAALQEQVALLIGSTLVLDGDWLAYAKGGNLLPIETKSLAAMLAFRPLYAPDISERRVRADLRREKDLDFEATASYQAVKRAFHDRRGVAPAYARLPAVTLHSPKLSRGRTTAWFAERVDTRYRTCLTRLERS